MEDMTIRKNWVKGSIDTFELFFAITCETIIT